MEGLINEAGDMVIQPEFDGILPPTEGLSAARIGDKWGYVDRQGRAAIAPRWASAAPFSDGLALVVERRQMRVVEDSNYERSLCGFVDRTGEYVIHPVWRAKCGSFHEGLAAVEVDKTEEEPGGWDGWAGYIDGKGQWAVPPHYRGAEDFSDGFGLVRRIDDRGKELSSFVDARGTVLKLPAGWAPMGSFSEGLAAVRQAPGTRVGVVDRSGALVFSMRAEALEAFSQGRAVLRKKGRFGYVDARGKVVVSPALFCAETFADGLARVCAGSAEDERYLASNGEVALVGGEGRPLGPFRGGLQYRFLKGRTISERPAFRNIYGYRNKSGKYVWLSPGSENAFDPAFWREKYVGPSRPGGAGR